MKYEENRQQFPDLMVDIETMGTASYSSIVSIGAVEFDIKTGQTGREFYRNISLQSCLDLGLGVDANTVMWWMLKSEKARHSLFEGELFSIFQALYEFSVFTDKECNIWGNSARFDLGLLQNAFNKVKIPICWDFKNERCVRTLVALNPTVKFLHAYEGVAHHALSDCHNQITYCTATWASLSPTKTYLLNDIT